MNSKERAAVLARVRVGWAARPGRSPGQAFQPGPITGGSGGPTVVARTEAELRAAIRTPGPVWVVALPSAGGHMSERLLVDRPDITIYAPESLPITGHGLRVDRAMNVAIIGLSVGDAVGDGIEISESRAVALRDCAVGGFTDGGIDFVRGSTDISAINCHIMPGRQRGGEKGCLIGADDQPFRRVFTGSLAHLGTLDDRFSRVWMEDCTVRAKVRGPMARHGRVTLIRHRIDGGGKGPIIEARTGARVAWVSGGVNIDASGNPRTAASYKSQDTVSPGLLYVAPGVDEKSARIEANWFPTAAQLAEMGLLP